uniref:Uncharacterized protein n=1 Tax=Cacopsylla melanoneura TaxID=428564 RepID=A0A8D9E365_9HEMI
MTQWRGEVQLNRQVKKRREMSKLGQGQEVLEQKKHRQGLSTYWEARRAVIDCMVLDQDIFGQGCFGLLALLNKLCIPSRFFLLTSGDKVRKSGTGVDLRLLLVEEDQKPETAPSKDVLSPDPIYLIKIAIHIGSHIRMTFYKKLW